MTALQGDVTMKRFAVLVLLAAGCRPAPPAPPPNAMPVRTFLATRPTTPCTFTLSCGLGVAGPSEAEEGLIVVDMRDDSTFQALHGRTPKDGAVGRALLAALADGKDHILTVEVVHREGDYPGDVDILRLLN
jgi:hypothetical protein